VNWTEDPSRDLEEYSFIPVEQDEDYMEEFKEVARSLFPEPVRVIERSEIRL